MADKGKEEKTYLKDMLNYKNDLERISKTTEAIKDPRSKINESGQKDVKKIAFDFAKKYGIPLDESTIDGEGLSEIFQQAQQLANVQYSDILYEHGDSIIDKEISASKLEKLALEEDIRKAVSGNDKNVIGRYLEYITSKEIADQYQKTGEIRAPEEQKESINKTLKESVIRGLTKDIEKNLEGKSKSEKNIILGLAQYAVLKGYIKGDAFKKYASAGLKENIKNTEENYKKAGDVSKAVGNTLKKMIKGNAEQFQTAGEFIYAVATEKDK